MNTIRPTSATLLALTVVLLVPALATSATRAKSSSSVSEPALRHSEQLWATIDICNPADQPDTVGIRGSMPGDGQARDTMYMHFRLQYMSTTSKRWVDLASGAQSGFVGLGSAKAARQTGWSFRLASGQPAFQLRGVVTFAVAPRHEHRLLAVAADNHRAPQRRGGRPGVVQRRNLLAGLSRGSGAEREPARAGLKAELDQRRREL